MAPRSRSVAGTPSNADVVVASVKVGDTSVARVAVAVVGDEGLGGYMDVSAVQISPQGLRRGLLGEPGWAAQPQEPEGLVGDAGTMLHRLSHGRQVLLLPEAAHNRGDVRLIERSSLRVLRRADRH